MFRSGSNDAKHEHRNTVERLINNKQREILPRFAPLNKNFKGGFAGGYIPNFADPLQDAIIREKAAGLPISQIRVNQSNRLRNASNPMGLAVTNTRDEPTGRIPNYAAAPKGSTGDVSGASSDLMMKFMGLTMAASMLQGVFSEMENETSNLSKGMGQATQAVMMMAMMAMMGGGKMGFAPLARGGMDATGRQMMMTGGVMSAGGGQARDARGRFTKGTVPASKLGGGLRTLGGGQARDARGRFTKGRFQRVNWGVG